MQGKGKHACANIHYISNVISGPLHRPEGLPSDAPVDKVAELHLPRNLALGDRSHVEIAKIRHEHQVDSQNQSASIVTGVTDIVHSSHFAQPLGQGVERMYSCSNKSKCMIRSPQSTQHLLIARQVTLSSAKAPSIQLLASSKGHFQYVGDEQSSMQGTGKHADEKSISSQMSSPVLCTT